MAACRHAGTPGYRTLQDRSRHRGISSRGSGRKTGPRWLSTEARRLQMGAGQGLDLTEFRGPLPPASVAPRASWDHSSAGAGHSYRHPERVSGMRPLGRVLHPVEDGRALSSRVRGCTDALTPAPTASSLTDGRVHFAEDREVNCAAAHDSRTARQSSSSLAAGAPSRSSDRAPAGRSVNPAEPVLSSSQLATTLGPAWRVSRLARRAPAVARRWSPLPCLALHSPVGNPQGPPGGCQALRLRCWRTCRHPALTALL